MKKTILISLFFLVSAMAFAQTHRFPAYSTQEQQVALDVSSDSNTYLVPDGGHTICPNVALYSFTGCIPQSGGMIALTGGSQNAATTNTPPAVICRALQAYQSASLTALTALYRTQDAATISSILAPDSVRFPYWAYVSAIDSIEYVLSYNQGSKVIAYVRYYRDTLRLLSTYVLTQVSGQWKLMVDSIGSTMDDNLAIYLDMHSTTDLSAPADIDGDGIPNASDNCPCTANPDQADSDHDGIGDACDNCPLKYNPQQEDFDHDGIGDVCDNCPLKPNPLQEDTDHDNIGDSCDNCITVVNPRQYDFDFDSIGDECDPDIDGDDIPNSIDPDQDGDDVLDSIDNCPMHFNPSQDDSDGDGIGDPCDNCPLNYNPDQTDTDGDGIGDACDDDADGDGVPDDIDNCKSTYNPDQTDTDCDGIGDACDPDIDGDGVPNELDNRPLFFNPDQD